MYIKYDGSYLKGSTKDFLLEDKFNKKFGKFI